MMFLSYSSHKILKIKVKKIKNLKEVPGIIYSINSTL